MALSSPIAAWPRSPLVDGAPRKARPPWPSSIAPGALSASCGPNGSSSWPAEIETLEAAELEHGSQSRRGSMSRAAEDHRGPDDHQERPLVSAGSVSPVRLLQSSVGPSTCVCHWSRLRFTSGRRSALRTSLVHTQSVVGAGTDRQTRFVLDDQLLRAPVSTRSRHARAKRSPQSKPPSPYRSSSIAIDRVCRCTLRPAGTV